MPARHCRQQCGVVYPFTGCSHVWCTDRYLDTKGIRHLLGEMTTMLLQRTPANPVQAIIDLLQADYPDLCVSAPPLALYDMTPFGKEVHSTCA